MQKKKCKKREKDQKRKGYLVGDRVKVLFVAVLHGFRWSSSEFDLEIGRPTRNGSSGKFMLQKPQSSELNELQYREAIVSAMGLCFGCSSCRAIFGYQKVYQNLWFKLMICFPQEIFAGNGTLPRHQLLEHSGETLPRRWLTLNPSPYHLLRQQKIVWWVGVVPKVKKKIVSPPAPPDHHVSCYVPATNPRIRPAWVLSVLVAPLSAKYQFLSDPGIPGPIYGSGFL